MKNFIISKILNDKKKKKKLILITRFAPEPSGFLHIGHLKCIYINYYIFKKFNGYFFVRIDDSNPKKIDSIFIKNILNDIKLFFKKKFYVYFSSFFFKNAYNFLKRLINFNLAYIDSQNKSNYLKNKGNYKNLGKSSIFFSRKKIENFYILKKMKSGNFIENEHCARLITKMYCKNILMRDPILFRIIKKKHIINNYNIYPSYDYINSLLDYYDKVTHSICTAEFINNRLLYNYYIYLYNKINKTNYYPRQIEFSRLNIEKKILSKRKMKLFMKKKKIKFWNDKRLMTLKGLLNKGFDVKSLIDYVKTTSYTRSNSLNKIDILKKIYIKNNKNLKRFFILYNPYKIYYFLKEKLKSLYINKKDFNLLKNKIIIIKNYFLKFLFLKYFLVIGKNTIYTNHICYINKKKKIYISNKKKNNFFFMDFRISKKLKINCKYIIEKIGIFKLYKKKKIFYFNNVIFFNNKQKISRVL
ncbi:glutamate--tRNA ligase family protein [Candidatus Vidania fulgoroideorum]